MTEDRKTLNPVRGLICGAFVSLVLWVILVAFVSIAWGISQRGIDWIVPGALFWVVVWAIGGALIVLLGEQRNNVVTVGAICGAIVGAATGVVLIVWPYCSQPTTPGPQDVVLSVGMPMLLAHDLVFGVLKLPDVWILHLSFSILFGLIFGVLLAWLIRGVHRKNAAIQPSVTDRITDEAPTSS